MPLVLLRQMLLALMQRGAGPWGALPQFGVTFLEEQAAEFIIQQGGWVRARAAGAGRVPPAAVCYGTGPTPRR